MTRIVLLHGAATTSAIWDGFAELLPEHEIVAPDRPRTGDLTRELAWLAPRVEDSWVVGLSGGATLGLALAASGTQLAGAVLHEPAVGHLMPELLAPMRAAFADGGTAAFGRTLYGSGWDLAMAGGHDDEVTARELAMFAGFEPQQAAPHQGPVVITVGAASPPARHRSVEALRDALGYRIAEVPGASHFVANDHRQVFAALILDAVRAAAEAPTIA